MDDEQDLGWLIRDTSNRIRGPFRQAEIVQLIKKGQLKGKTEVSRANSYWFAIEEKVELGRFLPEFNGGRPPPEQPTQMTATLTEADIQDHGVEVTTFTKLEKPPEAAKPEGQADGLSSSTGQIEWLSDEFAEEFGDDFGTTISVQTDASGLNPLPAEPPQAPKLDEHQPTPKDTRAEDHAKRQEMLKRASVKADTLPSEHKSFQGDRPKPIDTLMRSPGKPGSSAIKDSSHQLTVSVPVEGGPAPKMLHEEDETKKSERRSRRNLRIFVFLAVLIVIGGVVFFLMPKRPPPKKTEVPRIVRKAEEATAAARISMLAFDLEGTKNALADLEAEPGSRSETSTYLIQAVEKKEFLYDVESAMLALQTARQQARNKRDEAEVDNLMAVYGFDRDPAASMEMLRRNFESYKDDPIFRYNLALAQLRTNHQVEAIANLDTLLGLVNGDNALLEDVALSQGWALESHCAAGLRDATCKRSAEAEDAYSRALEANAASARALLGRALYKMRRQGIKASESDFRAFIDLVPDLDPPSRVVNFRKLSSNDFYAFAHAQIVEINNQNMGKPSPLVMAADAIISCILGRTSDAGKILEGALGTAPGDVNLAKATGYFHWKEGQQNEVVDALKDLRDRGSFAINLMLGKTYLKMRRRDLAEKYFKALMENYPERSEGFSLFGDLLTEDRPEEAKAQFQLALKKDPLDVVALRGLLRLNTTPTLSSDLRKNLPF